MRTLVNKCGATIFTFRIFNARAINAWTRLCVHAYHESQVDVPPRLPAGSPQPLQGCDVLHADALHILSAAPINARLLSVGVLRRHEGTLVAFSDFSTERRTAPMLCHHWYNVVVRIQDDGGQQRLRACQVTNHYWFVGYEFVHLHNYMYEEHSTAKVNEDEELFDCTNLNEVFFKLQAVLRS